MEADQKDLFTTATEAFRLLNQMYPDSEYTLAFKDAMKPYTVILQYPLETLETGFEAAETYTWIGEADNVEDAVKRARKEAEDTNDGDITDFPVLFVFRGRLMAECKGCELDV